jgi:hypothetical protein
MHCNDVRYTSAIKDIVSFDKLLLQTFQRMRVQGLTVLEKNLCWTSRFDTKTTEQCELEVPWMDMSLNSQCAPKRSSSVNTNVIMSQ